jgi:hypothetical protein
MFREVNKDYLKSTEEDRGLDKRWFRDAERECDIFVWQNDQHKIIRFQFWYHETLLEWDQIKGYKTGKVDATTGAFKSYQTTIFRYHTNFDQEILSNIQHLINGNNRDEIPHDIFDTLMIDLDGMN